jgi:hypothetical protein
MANGLSSESTTYGAEPHAEADGDRLVGFRSCTRFLKAAAAAELDRSATYGDRIADANEPTLQFTQSEFRELMDSVTKAATGAALKAANMAAALALEEYAEAVERAGISTSSPAARQGTDAALQAVAAEARASYALACWFFGSFRVVGTAGRRFQTLPPRKLRETRSPSA